MHCLFFSLEHSKELPQIPFSGLKAPKSHFALVLFSLDWRHWSWFLLKNNTKRAHTSLHFERIHIMTWKWKCVPKSKKEIITVILIEVKFYVYRKSILVSQNHFSVLNYLVYSTTFVIFWIHCFLLKIFSNSSLKSGDFLQIILKISFISTHNSKNLIYIFQKSGTWK